MKCGYKVGVGTYADMAETGTTSIIGPEIQVANRGVFFPPSPDYAGSRMPGNKSLSTDALSTHVNGCGDQL